MAVSVEVDELTKSRLERLQGEIEFRTGRAVTLQEILERLIDLAFESKSEFVDLFRESELLRSEEDTEAFFSGTTDLGSETSEEEIDENLYGDPDDV